MICQNCEKEIVRKYALSGKGKNINCLVYHCDCPEICVGMDIRWGLEDIRMSKLAESPTTGQ